MGRDNPAASSVTEWNIPRLPSRGDKGAKTLSRGSDVLVNDNAETIAAIDGDIYADPG